VAIECERLRRYRDTGASPIACTVVRTNFDTTLDTTLDTILGTILCIIVWPLVRTMVWGPRARDHEDLEQPSHRRRHGAALASQQPYGVAPSSSWPAFIMLGRRRLLCNAAQQWPELRHERCDG
jgi:hypothetical protein